MSENTSSENLKDQHSALTRLWPSDAEESKKLATIKQQKHQNLTDIGNQFKQAREVLGYNISDLNEHTGLSFTELEAMEQGQFQNVEQQDYLDYYVHTYAALLGLTADDILSHFQENYYANDDAKKIDIHDETQYEDAFAEEAKETLVALEKTNIDSLRTAESLHEQLDVVNTSPELETVYKDEPIATSSAPNQQNKLYWFMLILAFIAIIALGVTGYYFLNKTTTQNIVAEKVISNSDDQQAIPDAQRAKKIGTLESKIIQKGSTDQNTPTAISDQKPLIILNEKPLETDDAITLPDQATKTVDGIKNIIDKTIDPSSLTDQIKQAIVDKTVIDKVDTDIGQSIKKSLPVPNKLPLTNPKLKALADLPEDSNKYSLHSQKNSWILIEDDNSQILFNGELTPEKIITLPKIKGVIISLGDAGVINIYKGKELIGKLGKADEPLHLMPFEQRLNQIKN